MLKTNNAPSNLGRNVPQKLLRKEQDNDGDYQKRKKSRVYKERWLDEKITKCVNAQPMIRYAYRDYGSTFIQQNVDGIRLTDKMIQGPAVINNYEGSSITPVRLDLRVYVHTVVAAPTTKVPGCLVTLAVIQAKSPFIYSEVLSTGGAYRAIAPINQVPINKYNILKLDMFCVDEYRTCAVSNIKIGQSQMMDVEFSSGFNYGDLYFMWYVSPIDGGNVSITMRAQLQYTA